VLVVTGRRQACASGSSDLAAIEPDLGDLLGALGLES
jgi:hypothetical protein